jgi:hypothetical protein
MKALYHTLRELHVPRMAVRSTPQVAAFVCIQSADYPEQKLVDKRKQLDFTIGILCRFYMNSVFLPSILFSDEATFQQLGNVSQHNAHIWG